VTDAHGRRIGFFMTAGQVLWLPRAPDLLDSLPKAHWLLGDQGYDSNWLKGALQAKGITPASTEV